MRRPFLMFVVPFIGWAAVAHAIPANTNEKATSAAAVKPDGTLSITAPGVRTARQIIKTEVGRTRSHPDGTTLVADKLNQSIELKSGAKVLVSFTSGRSAGTAWATYTGFGKVVDSGDDALLYLNARERNEARDLLALTSAALPPKTTLNILFHGVPPGTLKKNLAHTLKDTSREARNFLALQALGVSVK